MTPTFAVDSQSEAVKSMSAPWPMIDALKGGTAGMRAAAKAFLPQFPQEPDEGYRARLSTAVLFNAFSRTASVMAAKPLSRPIQGMDALPDNIQNWLDNIDLQGSDLHSFATVQMLACMEHGISGVMVDCPSAEGLKTKADEAKAGLRPYLTTYPAWSILGWRTEMTPSGIRLSQLRLKETVTEPDGEFGEKRIKQVRVLGPGTWQIWRKVDQPISGQPEWSIHQEGRTSLPRVPFVFFYGLREGFGIGAPPLLDLAYKNVEHWQSSSDQQNILHVARVPILFAKGFSETECLTVSASSVARSQDTGADLKYVEHSGAAIAAGRQSIVDIEDQMRQLGAELLVQRPATTTATQTVSEGEGNKSTLQRIVEGFEDSLEECIKIMGQWVGEKIDPELTLFKDFGADSLLDQSADTLLRAADGDHVSSETVFNHLKRMGTIDPEASWEDETQRLDAQAQRRAANAPKADLVIPPAA